MFLHTNDASINVGICHRRARMGIAGIVRDRDHRGEEAVR